MTATLLAPPAEIINLSGISWKTYETLREELSDRRLRLTYNRGTLEIMAPSPEHELSKTLNYGSEGHLTFVSDRGWRRCCCDRRQVC